MQITECRGCGSKRLETVLDLGKQPISNNFLSRKDLEAELYPLELMACMSCTFLQLSESHAPEVHFNSRYPYFSGYSKTWAEHCSRTTDHIINYLKLKSDSLIIEIASNDGTFINNFKNKGFQVLGIEPSQNVALEAIQNGIPTVQEFFGIEVAKRIKSEYATPSLILGCNVLAHVPDIHGFIEGISLLLDVNSVACFEFPHATKMFERNEFDTIYHEHYSYLNITSLEPIFNKYELEIFKVETHELHGGSLRVYVAKSNSRYLIDDSVREIKEYEKTYGPTDHDTINNFNEAAQRVKSQILQILEKFTNEGKLVVIFGAAAKGTTLLNYCGITVDSIPFAYDSSHAKHGLFIPGTKIEIRPPEEMAAKKPDLIVILAWNFADEIILQIKKLFKQKIPFLIPSPIPKVQIE